MPFLGYKNKKFKKSKNWHFSKGVNPWFWSKNGHFCNFLFLGNIDQENVFYDIVEGKNAFLDYKNKKSNSQKIVICPKGLNHGFGPKMAIFPTLFFRQKRPGKCLLRFSRTSKRLSRLYKQVIQKVKKINVFPRGLTHGFGQKLPLFQLFFF